MTFWQIFILAVLPLIGTNYVGPVNPPPPEVRCPNGWKYWNNHCYYFGLESKTWDESRSWCQANLGSDLASITNEDENTYINNVLSSQYLNGWIGLHDDNAGADWHWMDGANYDYTNWMDGEPNNQDGVEHCGEIRASDYYYSGKWNDMPCDLLNSFVCKTSVKTCPQSWTLHNGKCYYASNFEVTWSVAREKCKEFNTEADLVSIHSEAESDFFGDVLTHSSLGTWIGYTYDSDSGQWVWSDGQPSNYSNWNDGEPNNLEDEACTEIIDAVGWDTHAKWNNMPCSSSRAFGCEFFPTHTVGCEEGWQTFGDYCYWYSNTDYSYYTLTFSEARDDCKSKGADMVSIHSQEENEFVYSLVADGSGYYYSTWLGLSDEGHPSELTWVDNTAVTFTSYEQMDYYPIYSTPACGIIDFAAYTAQSWGVEDCSDYNFYVCKKPQESTPINPPSNGCKDCPRDPKTRTKELNAKKLRSEAKEKTLGQFKLEEFNARKHEVNKVYSRGETPKEVNVENVEDLDAEEEELKERRAKAQGPPEDHETTPRLAPKTESKSPLLIRKPRSLPLPLDTTHTVPPPDAPDRSKRPTWLTSHEDDAPFTSTNFHSRFRNQQWSKHTLRSYQQQQQQHHDRRANWNARIKALLQRTTQKPVVKEISGIQLGLPKSTAESFTLSSSDGDGGDRREDGGDGGDGDGDGTEAPEEGEEEKGEEEGGGGVEDEERGGGGEEKADDGKGDGKVGGGGKTTVDPSTTASLETHNTTSAKPTETTPLPTTPTSTKPPKLPTSPTPTAPLTPVPSSPAPTTTTANRTEVTDAPTTPKPPPTGCNRTDVAYKGSCYLFPGLTHSWQDAKGVCETSNSHLVVLNDRFESAFLSSYLGELGERAWIGMSGAAADDGSVTFSWVNGEAVEFTNWAEYEPAPTHGTCVAASGRLETPGLWEVRDCNDNFQYVCEYDREGYTPPTPPTTPAPTTYCADGWERHGGRCYKVFKEPKTWGMAEGTCNSYGAFLTSVGSAEEQGYLQSLPGISSISGDFLSIWVGFHLAADSGYYWTDGSAADYVDWAVGQPDSHLGREGCVLVDKVTFKMSDSVCETFQPFICEAAEGTMLTTQAPPTQTPDVPCDDDPSWLLFNDYCYKFISEADEAPQTWWSSHRLCRNEGGELASIHTFEENYWIVSKIYNKTDQTLWIGGRSKLDSSYEWLDGSVFDFINWAEGEPNNFLDQEDCIGMYTRASGYWNDQNCAHTEGRICKRPHHATLPPAQSTVAPEGHCPSGWLHVGSKCFKFFTERLTFDDARTACQAQGPGVDMISVHSSSEQAHLSAALGQMQVNTWLGMRNERGFHWVDQSAVTYTNWAPGEPNGHYYGSWGPGEDCVEMLTHNRAGQWNDANCLIRHAFICQRNMDPNVGTHSPPPTCAPPLDNYLNYSGSCYKLVSTPTSWQDAEDACVSEGAHLASVQHVSEQSFLWVLALDTGVEDMWIGLNNLKDKVQYRWSDDWPTIYTNWAKNEPNTNQTDYNCVRLSAIKDGSWYSELCTEKRPYVCKHKDGPVPTPDPPATGRCPDDRWLNLGGGFCYLVVESAKPWNDASMKCVQENSHLASIHSQQEMDLITMATHKFRDPLWIGLVQKTSGYGWSDGTGFDYVNWQDGEPNSESEQCAEFYPGSGNWNDADCSNTRAFICKVLKIQDVQPTNPTVNPPPQYSTWKPGPSSLNAGGIVGIVIAVLFVVAGVGFVGVTYMKRKPKPVSNNGAYSFDNALYSESYDGAGSVTVGSPSTAVNFGNQSLDTDA